MIEYSMNIKTLMPLTAIVCFAPELRSMTPVTTRRASEGLILKMSPNTMKKRIYAACADMSEISQNKHHQTAMKLNFEDKENVCSVRERRPLITTQVHQSSTFVATDPLLYALSKQDKDTDILTQARTKLSESFTQVSEKTGELTTDMLAVLKSAKHTIRADVGVTKIQQLTANGDVVNVLQPSTLVQSTPVLSTKVRLSWNTRFYEHVMISLIYSQGISCDLSYLKEALITRSLEQCNFFHYFTALVYYAPYKIFAFSEDYHLNGTHMHSMLGVGRYLDCQFLDKHIKCAVSLGVQVKSYSYSSGNLLDRFGINISLDDHIAGVSFQKSLN